MSRKQAEIMSLEGAIEKFVKDGTVIAFGGFTGFGRNPFAASWEIVRQKIKKLHSLDRHGSCCTWLLNAVGALEIFETDWMGWGEIAGKLDLNMERQYKNKNVILEDYAHGGMALRLFAGAIGAPFIPYYGAIGSDLYNEEYDSLGKAGLRDGSRPKIAKKKFVSMDDPFWGEGKVNLLPAAKPDVTIIHVAQAGDKGTARWRGVSSADKETAFAADKVILTCEEIIPEEEMRKNPENNQIPFFIVDAIVECPYGAYPSAVPYFYDYDAPFMREMDAVSRDEKKLAAWMNEWIFEPENWEKFVEKIGAKKMLDLKADSTLGYSTRLVRGQKPPPRMTKPLSIIRSGF